MRALRLLPLLVLVLLAARLSAEPETSGPLDLSGARVLASPGWPHALAAFLPPGRTVEPLALPLPPGPLLVLGITGSDPVARALGESLLGLDAEGDLGGGYVVSAWKDGQRPIGVLLGEDAAALAAARFELETFTPSAKEGTPRSVDVTKPDEQAGVRMALGRRQVKPRFRVRGLAGLGPGETYLDVAGAHGNRAFVDEHASDRDLALLRDHGVVPVWRIAAGETVEDAHGVRFARDLDELLAPARKAQERDVRHFALDFRGRAEHVDPAALLQARRARDVADRLRPGGLDELLILRADLHAPGHTFGAPAFDLTAVPEAVLGWAGDDGQPLEVSRPAASDAHRRAGGPVAFVETWMEAAAGDEPRLPTLPRGRAADLGEVLDGVWILPGPGSAQALSAAWAPPQESESAPEIAEVLGACSLDVSDAATFFVDTAACLDQMLAGRYADPPWLRGLPQRLRKAAGDLPPPYFTLLARWVPEAVVVDGRLDDRAWAHAPPVTLSSSSSGPAIQGLAVSDGRSLVLGVRVPDQQMPITLIVTLETGGHILQIPLLPQAPASPRSTRPDDPYRVAVAHRGEAVELEVALGHYALGGDPYPTRVFRIGFEGADASGSFWWPYIVPEQLQTEPGPHVPPRNGALVVVR